MQTDYIGKTYLDVIAEIDLLKVKIEYLENYYIKRGVFFEASEKDDIYIGALYLKILKLKVFAEQLRMSIVSDFECELNFV